MCSWPSSFSSPPKELFLCELSYSFPLILLVKSPPQGPICCSPYSWWFSPALLGGIHACGWARRWHVAHGHHGAFCHCRVSWHPVFSTCQKPLLLTALLWELCPPHLLHSLPEQKETCEPRRESQDETKTEMLLALVTGFRALLGCGGFSLWLLPLLSTVKTQ